MKKFMVGSLIVAGLMASSSAFAAVTWPADNRGETYVDTSITNKDLGVTWLDAEDCTAIPPIFDPLNSCFLYPGTIKAPSVDYSLTPLAGGESMVYHFDLSAESGDITNGEDGSHIHIIITAEDNIATCAYDAKAGGEPTYLNGVCLTSDDGSHYVAITGIDDRKK